MPRLLTEWKRQALELANAAQTGRSVSMPNFRVRFFCAGWKKRLPQQWRALSHGDHPYARMQLLTVARAQNQGWSHLIFAGWNEGAWPPSAGAEFARADEIPAFNRSVQPLNKRAALRGSQGEGHTSCARKPFALSRTD